MAKAAELMKVVPSVTVPVAYVGLIAVEGPEVIARTYDDEGNTIADIGQWAGSLSAGDPVAFVRGASEGSLAGCAAAWLTGTQLVVLDLEAPDLVQAAATHRPAEGGGLLWNLTIRAGADKFWEAGMLTGILADGSGTSFVLFTRTVGVDGVPIAAGASQTGHPLDGELPNDVIDTEGIFPAGVDSWGAIFRAYDDEQAPQLFPVVAKTVNEAGTFVETADREANDGVSSTNLVVPVGVVLGSSVGAPLTRIVVDTGGPFEYDGATSRYVAEALFAIPSFTVVNAGTRRTAGTLVALVSEGSTATHAASRLCTYAGSHPITTSTAGPAFERADATETLLVVFGA